MNREVLALLELLQTPSSSVEQLIERVVYPKTKGGHTLHSIFNAGHREVSLTA